MIQSAQFIRHYRLGRRMGEEVYHISLRTSQMINVVRLIMIIGVIYVHTIPVLDTIDSPIITAFASLMRGPIGTSGIALFFFCRQY